MNLPQLEKDDVDRQLEEIFQVLGPTAECSLPPLVPSIDPEVYRWQAFVPRVQDKIGDQPVDLSSPSERGWHTCSLVRERFLVVFGGFTFRGGSVPQPFSVFEAVPSDYKFYDDVCVLDTLDLSWSTPRVDHKPPGRFGHVSVAMDEDHLLVFGGRGVAGSYLHDTWVFSLSQRRWTDVSSRSPIHPSARAFCSGMSALHRSFVFGGTNGEENFCDLWSFGLADCQWRREVVGGMPPSPRYGHAMLKLSESSCLVIGGCAVSPSSETRQGADRGIDLLHDIGEKNESASSSTALIATDNFDALQTQYRVENVFVHDEQHRASVGTDHISFKESPDRSYFDSVKSLLHQMSVDAATKHLLEKETRLREQQVVDAWQREQATQYYETMKARHPSSNIDVFALSLEDSFWEPISCKGKSPSARMHFGAILVGTFVILFGGTNPTSTTYSPVDEGSLGESKVFVLNTKGMKWSKLTPPRDTTTQMDIPIEIAKNEIIRAKNRLRSERDKGHMLGAKNGLTVEVSECEAILEVCKWRLRVLYQEREELRDPPRQRWGHTLECSGQRAYLIGGWNSERVAPRQEILILDFEDELERRRRRELEFHARLERERVAEEKKRYEDDIFTKHELEVLRQAEREREAMESQKMREEDIRCSFPPLYKPSPVKFVAANRSTIWLQWDPIRLNSRGLLVDSSSLTYLLYKKADLKVLLKGDRVSVFQGESSRVPYFEGTIISLNLKANTFAVKYDMKRGTEKGVQRNRIVPIMTDKPKKNLLDFNPFDQKCTIDLDPSQWVLLYSGNLTNYACTNLVSSLQLEQKSDQTFSFTFALQVLGVDYPLYEKSQLSDPVTFNTSLEKNPTFGEHHHDKRQTYRCVINEGVNVQFERRNIEYFSIGTFDHFI